MHIIKFSEWITVIKSSFRLCFIFQICVSVQLLEGEKYLLVIDCTFYWPLHYTFVYFVLIFMARNLRVICLFQSHIREDQKWKKHLQKNSLQGNSVLRWHWKLFTENWSKYFICNMSQLLLALVLRYFWSLNVILKFITSWTSIFNEATFRENFSHHRAQWWEKFPWKRRITKHTCSWRDKLITEQTSENIFTCT